METSTNSRTRADRIQSSDIHLRISKFSCTIDSGSASKLEHFRGQKGFYLQVDFQGWTRWTSTTKAHNTPSWDDCTYLNPKGKGDLAIQLFVQHTRKDDSLVGKLALPVEVPITFNTPKDFKQQNLVNEKKQKIGTISFTIEPLAYSAVVESLRLELEKTSVKAGQVIHRSSAVAKIPKFFLKAHGLVEGVGGEYSIWKSLVDNVQFVVDLGNVIAKIHPFAQMVWSALSPVLKMVIQQGNRDADIIKLLLTMNDAYESIRLWKTLTQLDLYRCNTINQILQQTYECSWFIRNYVSRGFVKRGIKAMITGQDNQVQQYINAFAALKARFQDGSSVAIELVVHRTLAVAKDIRDDQLLSKMKRAEGQDQDRDIGCLPGTRRAILNDIIDWVARASEEEPCVYWLHGVAGCGKSSIAASIVHHFRSLKRCVSFFFDASKKREAGPNRLFSTLSWALANLDHRWKSSLIRVLEESSERETSNVKRQFEDFILKPVEEFEPIGPIVIVIDALDESGSPIERMQMLRMLSRLNELKGRGQFRFLITSRSEEDIAKIFQGKHWVLPSDLTYADEASTDSDIRTYVERELSSNTFLLEKWPEKPWENLIVHRAGHLFQWAHVACMFIKGHEQVGFDPVKRYQTLCDDTAGSQLGELNKLYTTVLGNLFESKSGETEDDDRIPRLRTILGRILSVREPLSFKALSALRPNEESERDMKLLIRPLGSLLKGVDKDDVPVQPLHASFIDFLKDKTHSGDYYIEDGSQDENLIKASLREMNDHLRFNICSLETSYLRNREVKDLPTRIKENIPEHLSYACRHFTNHLSNLQHPSPDVLLGIKTFLHEKFLFWLEALSLLERMYLGSRSLQALGRWLQTHESDTELRGFVSDAERFARTYNAMMAASAPHIYLSGLGFMPQNSHISHQYCGQYPGRLKLNEEDDEKIRWPSSLLNIKLPNGGGVFCAQFSPDGQRIVSGSGDKGVRVWDAHSGELVAGPFTGHTFGVTSVGFSPDGQRIVSGSDDNSVRVWDAHSGELVAGPFTGHTSWVTSVGFSPDGQRIVSGSWDNSVRVWDAHSGELVAGPFIGHTSTSWVTSVGLSPDGQRIVSGSLDKSVRVWDAHSGELVAGPFTGHTDSVTSVMFSPNGQRIISGSNDNCVRVWSMKYSGESLLHSSRLSSSYIEYSDSSEIDMDGWMVSPSGDLLFWVPDMYRAGLWRPGNTLVIGPESIRVDVTQFVHGSEWIRCYQSQE